MFFFIAEAYMIEEDEQVLTTMPLNKDDLGFEILVRNIPRYSIVQCFC